MHMLYVGDVSEAAMVFRILMCCFMGTTTQYVFGTLLTANGNLKYLNIIAGCGMVFNIGVNLILIPRFHALGAAMTSLMTQLLVPGLQVIVAQRVFKFTILPKMMLTLFLFAVGTITIAYGTTHLPFDWKGSFIVMIGACVIWAFLTGVVNIKSILKTVKLG